MYRRVAEESPHGEGSIAMLERLLSFWKGKLFVLTLLGFAATDFLITITLSAADASTHLVENPHLNSALHDKQMLITLILVALLGAVFLKGFLEAIGVAFALVGIYLSLNVVVVIVGLWHVATGQELFAFPDQPHFVNSLAFSADGHYLAAALHDGSLRLWQAADGP